MNQKTSPARHLKNPPLVEVVLSIQFDPLDLNLPEFASFWDLFKEEFPKVEEQAPLPPIPEPDDAFQLLRAQFQVLEKPALPRLWFLNDAGSQLIQIQNDRLSHNWRKLVAGDEYPHFAAIRDTFRNEIDRLHEHLLRLEKTPLKLVLCELSYIDHIDVGVEPKSAGALGDLLLFWQRDFKSRRLGEPSEASCAVRFPLKSEDGSTNGSLSLSVQPALRKDDRNPILLVQTVARGRPIPSDTAGAFHFFDRAHTECVELFFEIARPEVRSRWEEVKA